MKPYRPTVEEVHHHLLNTNLVYRRLAQRQPIDWVSVIAGTADPRLPSLQVGGGPITLRETGLDFYVSDFGSYNYRDGADPEAGELIPRPPNG